MNGPFFVVIKRSNGWWKVTASFKSRQWRGIGRTHSNHRERADALESAKVFFNQMRAI
jgi:hypothetical protein